MSQVWKVGASSESLSIPWVEYIRITDEHPTGRYTTDKSQAEIWAQELADSMNIDINSGATDWKPEVQLGDMPDWSK